MALNITDDQMRMKQIKFNNYYALKAYTRIVNVICPACYIHKIIIQNHISAVYTSIIIIIRMFHKLTKKKNWD